MANTISDRNAFNLSYGKTFWLVYIRIFFVNVKMISVHDGYMLRQFLQTIRSLEFMILEGTIYIK